MKRLFLLIFLFLFCLNVKAEEPLKFYSVVNKCSVISDKFLVVPVKVVSTNKGKMTTLISKYKLGNIYNSDDILVEVKNVTEGFKVSLDYLKDEDNFSNVYFYNSKEINASVNENILSFEFKITFNKEVPETINILGNEVLINKNASVCEYINGYEIKSYEKEVLVKKNNVIVYVLIIVMGFVIAFMGGLLWKCKKGMKN